MARKRQVDSKTKTAPARPYSQQRIVLPRLAALPKPPLFVTILSALAPHLNGTAVAGIQKSRIPALAKKTGISRKDLTVMVDAHRLGRELGVATETLFALGKKGVALEKAILATEDPVKLRKSMTEATKLNLVSSDALTAFDGARAIFARLQATDASLVSLKKAYALPVPDALIRKLESKNIYTLADLRERGGVNGVKGLNVSDDDRDARLLDAHAGLSILGTDIPTNAKLIKRGYESVFDIGRLPTHAFVSSLRRDILKTDAEDLHRKAVVQKNYIENVITESRVQALSASHTGSAPSGVPSICGCPKCQDATSPLSYLADLLNYTLDHLTNNGIKITLTFLQNRFHQPFRDLPFECAQLDKRVRVARICVEVLRKHLPATTANTIGGWYLEAAYLKFLEDANTTYDELRAVARGNDQNDKDELANRMMLPGGQFVDRLFRDPAAPGGDLLEITEQWLQRTFGLRDSTLGPLEPDEEQPLILAWKKRFLRNQWQAEDYSLTRRPLGDYPVIDPDIVGTADLANAIPNPMSRNSRPKTDWSALDFLEDRAGSLRNIEADLRSLVPGPRSQLLQQLSNLLTQLQNPQLFFVGVTGMEGLTADALLDLHKREELGEDISLQLSGFALAYDEYRALVDVLVATRTESPVLNSEWDGFYGVILQRIKRAVLFPQWRQEESNARIAFGGVLYRLLLSPDNFRERPDSGRRGSIRWRPVKWRSSEAIRRKWEETLRARIEQEQTLMEALRSSVEGVEETLLVELRSDLLRVASLPGLLTPAKLKWFTDHYQVDFEAGRCQATTRVAQAIQTLQGVLWGVRNGLLDDLGLLLDAPDFDEEWKWLGSYGAWRAATQVFLYPENTLRPTLRRSMSPAFSRMIEHLRNAAPVSTNVVRKEVDKFEEYFADVCSLSRSATYEATSPFGLQDENVFAISRGGRSRQLYFSSWKRLPGWGLTGSPRQSFWERIEGLEEAREITGLVPYRSPDGTTHLGVYARTLEQANVRYWFADFDGTDCKGQALSSDLPVLVRSARYGEGVLPPSPEFASRGGQAWLLHRDDRIVAFGSDILLWSGRVETDNNRRIGLARARLAGLEIVAELFIDRFWELSNSDHPAIFPDGVLVVARTTPQRIALLGLSNGQLGLRGSTTVVSGPSGSWTVKLKGTRHSAFAAADIMGKGGGSEQLVVFEYEGEPGRLSARTYGTLIDVVNSTFIFVSRNAIDNEQPHETYWDGPDLIYIEVQDHWSIGTVIRDGGGKDMIVVITRHVYAESENFGDPAQGYTWVGVLTLGSGNSLTTRLKLAQQSQGEVFVRQSELPGWTWRDDQQFTTVKRASGGDAFLVTNPTSDDIAVMALSSTGQIQKLWSGTQSVGNGTTGWSHKSGDRILPVRIYKDGNSQLFAISSTSDLLGLLSRRPDSTLQVQWSGRRLGAPSEVGIEGWSPTSTARYAVADIDRDGYDEIVAHTVSDAGVVELAILRAIPRASASEFFRRDGPEGVSLLTLRPEFSEGRRIQIQQGYAANVLLDGQGNPSRDVSGNLEYILQNLPYLDEAYLFLPLEVGIRLREAGDYASALDWFRSVYDYDKPLARRKLAYRLVLEEGEPQFARLQDWLLDPLDPHAIAETRKGSYSKFTVLSIVRCLLDYADAEFTRATSESLPRARELYLRALDLLSSSELLRHSVDCSDLIGELTIEIGDPEFEWVRSELQELLGTIVNGRLLVSIMQQVKAAFAGKRPLLHRFDKAIGLIKKARDAERPDTVAKTLTKHHSTHNAALLRSLSNKKVMKNVEMIMAEKEDGFGKSKDGSKGRWIPAPSLSFCIPLNPVVEGMRRHAELCLEKLRNCRNIAGLELVVELYGVSSASLRTGVEFGSGDQLPSIATEAFQPLPYRYATLVERAKQLIEISGRIEASMLSTLESADRAQYDELKARQDLGLAQASVRLKDLQVSEAEVGVISAELQRANAQGQADHYRGLIRKGLTTNENIGLGAQWSAYVAKQAYVTAAIAREISPKGFITAILQWGGAPKDIFSAQGDAFSVLSTALSTQASYERREQEWNFSAQLANQEVAKSEQQIEQATSRVFVATQERAIANLQVDHAEQVLNFLVTKKFGTSDLYEWMSAVLEQVYRFFLRQATQIARLAELQLSFERQEAPRGLIKVDYWEPLSGRARPDLPSQGQQQDVKGLTGSARLLRDIYELDQYAFTKNQRKLQLTETISLASLDPFAFQQFRQTGLLRFRTSMPLFDQKFPGHYLRLIRRVRLSVVALIPPVQGVRATLSTTGTSRVAIGRETFQTVQVQKGPEAVALTAPLNASGLFELDAQPELLVPFEGLGVDATWALEMPKASNPFDFSTIADVLFTLEYTALHSYDYRQQVLDKLDKWIEADRSFSFRSDFADAWYDLNNPDLVDPARQMIVSFETRRTDFPPNLVGVSIRHLVLYFVQADGTYSPITVNKFVFTPKGGNQIPPDPIGTIMQANSSNEGIISTRRGQWVPLIGSPIEGTWELSLPNTAPMKNRFRQEQIKDILLVISYVGELPEWPS